MKVRCVGRQRFLWGRATQAAGLRRLFGGRDEVRHEGRIGPRHPAAQWAMLLLWRDRHQRDAGRSGARFIRRPIRCDVRSINC